MDPAAPPLENVGRHLRGGLRTSCIARFLHVLSSCRPAGRPVDPSEGPVLVLGFTSDRHQAEIAIDTLGVPDLLERSGDPLELVIDSLASGGSAAVQAPSAGGARKFDTAEAIMSGREGGDLEATSLALPFRGIGGKAYVPVVVGIDGPSLLSGLESIPTPVAGNSPAPTEPAAELPVEIYAYAVADDGTIGDFFGQTIGLDLAKVGERVRRGGIEYVGHLELASGDWPLRVLARNGRTGALRVSVLPLWVPAFEDGRAVLLAPVFLPHRDPEAPALLLRETPHGELGESPYPFQLEGQPFVPAAVPVAPRGEISRVALFAWNLPESDVRARAQVLDGAGQEIPGGRFRLVGSEAAPGGGDLLAATFEPTDLAPGTYRLRVRLALGDGTSTVDAEPISFEVR